MSVLNEIDRYLSGLRSSKVTERKRSCDKLSAALQREYVRAALNHASASKTGISWSYVADNAVKFIAEEHERASEKARAFDVALTLRDVSASLLLFKSLVQAAATQRLPYLNPKTVLEHISKVLSNKYTGQDITSNYVSFLLDILVTPYWHTVLPSMSYNALVRSVCACIRPETKDWSSVAISRALQILVTVGFLHSDIDYDAVIDVAPRCLQEVRSAGGKALLGPSLAVLVHLGWHLGISHRHRLCSLGETLLWPLFSLLSSNTLQLKEQFVELLQVQLSLHHPCGARTEEEGAYACDWDEWRRLLEKLYVHFLGHLDENTGASIVTASEEEARVLHKLVVLASDAAYQLQDKQVVLPTSSLSSYLSPEPHHTLVQVGPGPAVDALCSLGPVEAAAPWLELLAAYLQKYPTSVDFKCLKKLLEFLSRSYSSCKVVYLKKRMLLCCRGVALASEGRDCIRCSSEPWLHIWGQTVKTVSLNQCLEEGHLLLQELLHQRLIYPCMDFFSLFCPGFNHRPELPALQTLATLLSSAYFLPQDCPQKLLSVSRDISAIPKKHRCRISVLEWLLPAPIEDMEVPMFAATQNAISKASTGCNSLPVAQLHKMGEILASLCLGKTSLSLSVLSSCAKENARDQRRRLEEELLRQSLVRSPLSFPCDQEASHEDGSSPKVTFLGPMWEAVVDILMSSCQAYTEKNETLSCLQRCYVGVVMLLNLWHLQAVDEDTLSCSPLYFQIKSCIGDAVKELLQCLSPAPDSSLEPEKLYDMLALLQAIFSCVEDFLSLKDEETCMSQRSAISCWIAGVFPSEFSERLLSFVQSKDDSAGVSQSSLNGSTSSSRVVDDFGFEQENVQDDFAPTTQCMESCGGPSAGKELDDQFGSVKGSSAGTKRKELQGILSPEHLSQNEAFYISIARLLLSYLHVTSNTNETHFEDAFFGLIDAARAAKGLHAYFVQLGVVVLKATLSDTFKLEEEHLLSIIDLLITLMRAHQKHHELCAALLEVTLMCLPRVGCCSPDSDCRKCYFVILGAFGLLNQQEKLNEHVTFQLAKLAFECCKAPYQEWVEFNVNGQMQRASEFAAHFLGSKYTSVRNLAVHNVAVLFNGCNTEKEWILFDRVYNLCAMYLVNNNEKAMAKSVDEQNNSHFAFLSAMANIAAARPHLAGTAIFSLFDMITQKGLPTKRVARVLQFLSEKQYGSWETFIAAHIECIVFEWLRKGHPLASFPVDAVWLDTVKEFLTKHYKVVASCAVLQGSAETVSYIANVLGVQQGNLILECLPVILSRILPYLAHDAFPTSAKQKAVAAYRFLGSLLSELCEHDETNENQQQNTGRTTLHEVTEQDLVVNPFLRGCVDKVVASLLLLASGSQYEQSKEQKACPPRFSAQVILSTLRYLHSACCSRKEDSLVAILLHKRDSLQHIVASVSGQIQEGAMSLTPLEQLLELLVPGFAGGSLGGTQRYVFRSIALLLLRRLLALQTNIEKGTKENSQPIIEDVCLAITLLSKLYRAASASLPQEVARNLPDVINVAVLFVRTCNNSITDQVRSLIEFFIQDDRYTRSFLHVHPLPDFIGMQELQEKLKEIQSRDRRTPSAVVTAFADALDRSLSGNFRDTLELLCKYLSQNRRCLMQLVKEIQGKMLFSEDVSSSPVHRLVATLFKLAKACAPEVQAVAMKCLGVLGPLHLNAPSLVSQQLTWLPVMTSDMGSPSQYCFCVLFTKMQDYVNHPEPAIANTACQVLKDALSTRTGCEFVSRHRNGAMKDVIEFLYPFTSEEPMGKTVQKPKEDICGTPDLWPSRLASHGQWIKGLVCALIYRTDCDLLLTVVPLCEVLVELCEALLPFVIQMALKDSLTDAMVANFFDQHVTLRTMETESQSSLPPSTTASKDPVLSSVYTTRASVEAMLSAVEYLTVRKKEGARTIWKGFHLDLNFLNVATAAEFCGWHFAVLQYVELWWDQQAREQRDLRTTVEDQDLFEDEPAVSHSEEFSWSASPFLLWEGPQAVQVQQLLLAAYSGLGDEDGLYGCRCLALPSEGVWDKCAEQQGDWASVLASADLQSAAGNVGTAKALKQCGLYRTLSAFLHDGESPDLMECQGECAWRLAEWDFHLSTKGDAHPGFHQGIFTTLSAIASNEAEGIADGLETCRKSLSTELSNVGLGVTHGLYALLSKLQMYAVLKDGVDLHRGDAVQSEVLEAWLERAREPGCSFQLHEPVAWLQTVLLRELSHYPLPIQAALLECYASQARHCSRFLLAERALKDLESLAVKQNERWKLEEVRVHYAKGNVSKAQHMLWTLLKSLKEDPASGTIYAEALQLYGQYLWENRLENSDTIARDYLEKATTVLQRSSGVAAGAVCDAYLTLARFADSRYQNIDEYLRSPEHEDQISLLEHSHSILDCTSTESRKVDHVRLRLQRQHDLDKQKVKEMQQSRMHYLLQALRSYLLCLQGTHSHDLRAFRLAALWFQNSRIQQVNQLVQNELQRLETYKFVPLIYQLAARMGIPESKSSSDFRHVLGQLIERVLKDHPFQALPVLLAMCNADKDTAFSKAASHSVETPPRHKKAKISIEERVEVAQHLVNRARKGPLARIVLEMDTLMDAYIQLAYMTPPQMRGSSQSVALQRSVAIMKIVDLSHVPVLTKVTEVDRSCKYVNVPGIHKFLPHYELCGGINMPKKVTCIGQDGIPYTQLVKGRDDLRQDAVMQQVFQLVNQLLEQDSNSCTFKLHVRTYKVVPLSRRSGILQWCEGTQPFGEYLTNPRTGAHVRYHPSDLAASDCRSKMRDVAQASPEVKLKVFQEICSNFHPVFRYFFLEKFPEPTKWFERRQAYVRSTATGSIVGYILGLGDRHCNNILVDKHTAEVIHIDLGVAFEQGKTLNTPETVPFRLTRDVVDGMGISGVEGTFRRCCERTMQVMRNSQEYLLTIVEVLLYDPLSAWTLSPEQAAALQRGRDQESVKGHSAKPFLTSTTGGVSDNKNRFAQRVLLRLKQKLQGQEEGAPLSVTGQVNLLIQQARDPANLCRLFSGWQPYV